MMGDGFGFIMGYGLNLWIFSILFIILFLWLYSVITNYNDSTKHSSKKVNNHLTPLEILEQRYAEGKIDEEEYNLRKKNLLKDIMP